MSERESHVDWYLNKRLSRRQLLQIGAGAGSAGLLAACGVGASPPPSPASPEGTPASSPDAVPTPTAESFSGVNLSVWGSPLMEAPVKDAGTEWGQLSGGSVAIEVIPFAERPAKFAGLIASQDPSIDLLYGWAGFVAQFGDLLYEDLDALGVDKSDFLPAAVAVLGLGGKLRIMPLHSEMEIFIYNKEYFAAADLDPETRSTTWDELFAAASALTSGNRFPGAVPWGPRNGHRRWLNLYNSFPESKFLSDDRTQLLFDNDDALTVWQTLDRGFKAKFWDPAFYSGIDSYATGRVFNGGGTACMMNFSELWGQAVSGNAQDFGTTISKDVVGATIVPGVKPNTSGSTNGFEGLGINKYSRQKEAALSFARYLTGAEFEKNLLKYNLPSSRLSVLSDAANLQAFPIGTVLAEQGKFNLDRWAAPYEWGPVFEEIIVQLIKGEVTPEQAHENSIEGVRKVIVDYLTT